MNRIYASLARLAIPKLVRQVIAAAGGYVAAAGVTVDAHNLNSLIAGGLMWAVTALWSLMDKSGPDQGWREILRKLVEAVTAQGVSFASGWLMKQGFAGNPADTEAVTIFLANIGVSAVTRPDARKEQLNR